MAEFCFCGSQQVLAAGDEDLRPGDVGRLGAAEIVDGRGHLLRLAEAGQGMRGISTSVSGDSIAVSISPGAMALTRTPMPANSTAISRVSPERAAFEVE